MPRGKKTNKAGLVKNPGVSVRRGRSVPEAEEDVNLVDSFENIHQDETPLARRALQQEPVSDGEAEESPAAPRQSSSSGKEAQSQSAPPSWFMRYGNLLDSMIAKQEENSNKMTELSDQIDTKEHNHVWKKGLKRQNEVAEKVLKKSKAVVASIDLGHTERARQYRFSPCIVRTFFQGK